MDNKTLVPLAELSVVVNGVRYGDRCGRQDECPYCGRVRKATRDPRGEGFSLAGFKRHVFACYEAALAAHGLCEGVYDPDMMKHPLVPIPS